MKTNVFLKVMCLMGMMVATVSVAKAQEYITHDKMEGEVLVTRFIYKVEDDLQYHLKSDFAYDDQNRLVTKETFLWNERKQKWIPRRRIHYSYQDSKIIITGDNWDKHRRVYTENVRQSSYEIQGTGLQIVQLMSEK